MELEMYQLWSLSDEYCQEGTILIRRIWTRYFTSKFYQRFSRKIARPVRRYSSNGGRELVM
ncbi:hypothetical protein HanPI659440_Chr15g0597151 [Helianthus annuus]|nr:hypothetical protein HanPI659440_Chr15g0597151 [Helianthus annuus]